MTSGSTLLAAGVAVTIALSLVILWESGRIGGSGPFRDAIQERLQRMHPRDRSFFFQTRYAALFLGIFLAVLGCARLIGLY